jgi:hypothetical protein
LSSTLPATFPTMGAAGSNKTKHATILKALNAYGESETLWFTVLQYYCWPGGDLNSLSLTCNSVVACSFLFVTFCARYPQASSERTRLKVASRPPVPHHSLILDFVRRTEMRVSKLSASKLLLEKQSRNLLVLRQKPLHQKRSVSTKDT